MLTCLFLTAFPAPKHVAEKRRQEMAEWIELNKMEDLGQRERPVRTQMHAKQGLGSDVQEVAGELSRSSASRGLKSRRG